MILTLELSEQTEKQLRDLAAKRGQDIQEFMLSVLDKALVREDKSPLDVPGVNTGITTKEIIEFIHEGRGNDRW